jgi:4-hydroxy-3-methylbut-2-enyl diphosphate reductase
VDVDQVLLAAPRGFCAGVEMAIKALAWMVRVFEPPVYCYHEIVHNQVVVDRFRRLGVVFVDDVATVPPGAPLMLSAHGSAPEVVAAARANGGVVVDAVCPLITKVHHEVKVRSKKGYTVVYVGHEGHDEAVGTMAVAPEALHLVESVEDVERLQLRDDRNGVALLAQTTLSHFDWQAVLDAARERFPDLWMPGRDDLCFATTNRQSAVKAIAPEADAFIIVGSENSSNTRALVKVAKAAGCERSFRIDSVSEITDAMLAGARVVGVSAGASAPEELVQQVINRIGPRNGVRLVHVTDEDEYFPPPRDLREVVKVLDSLIALMCGGDPQAARAMGGPFTSDRSHEAILALESVGA